MCTPESKLTPKNYIVSGINKSLLTPCRRVGLSRSKNTPKSTTPGSVNPGEDIYKTPANTNRKKDIDLDNATQTSVKAGENNNIKTKTPEKLSAHIEIQSSIAKGNSLKLSKTSGKENSTQQSPANPPLIEHVTAQIHQPAVKRSINFDEVHLIESSDKTKNYSSEKFFNKTNKHQIQLTNDSSENIKDNRFSITNNIQEKLPVNTMNCKASKEPIFALERNKNDVGSPTAKDITDSVQKSLIKSKKRKLRLSSDNLPSTENESKTKIQIICNSKEKYVKSNTDNTLARFNTEDYLNEYYQNPKDFQKCLEVKVSPLRILEDQDSLVDFMPNTGSSYKKVKSEDIKEKNQGKAYMAVMLPTTKETICKDIGKTTKKLQGASLDKKLATSQDYRRNINKDNKKSNLYKNDSMQKATKSFTLEESDDEMFTSSPQNDRKERENLLQLINRMEKEMRQKEEAIEGLKRVQVYKQIHSPEKVKESSERWIKGCKEGLRDLLLKMQYHTPMEMETLVKNLAIPDDIINSLNLF